MLDELTTSYDQACRVDPSYRERGLAPLDFGGTNGSDHSYRATKLVKLGLAEHRKRGLGWGSAPTRGYRGSKLYRPTEAGRAMLQERN